MRIEPRHHWTAAAVVLEALGITVVLGAFWVESSPMMGLVAFFCGAVIFGAGDAIRQGSKG
jgi:hypothetical protein